MFSSNGGKFPLLEMILTICNTFSPLLLVLCTGCFSSPFSRGTGAAGQSSLPASCTGDLALQYLGAKWTEPCSKAPTCSILLGLQC